MYLMVFLLTLIYIIEIITLLVYYWGSPALLMTDFAYQSASNDGPEPRKFKSMNVN